MKRRRNKDRSTYNEKDSIRCSSGDKSSSEQIGQRPIPRSVAYLLFGLTPTFPLELFRVISGGLFVAYYIELIFTSQDLIGRYGLLDAEVTRNLLFDAYIDLFLPHAPAGVVVAVWVVAAILALLLLIGYQARLCAFLLFAISVSTFRRLYIVSQLDDFIICYLSFWLALLPIGRGLNLYRALTRGKLYLSETLALSVEGASLRLFIASLCLIYFDLGLFRYNVPGWHSNMIVESALCFYPVLWLIGKGSKAWLLLLTAQIGLHTYLLVAIGAPYTNIGLISSGLLFFPSRINGLVKRHSRPVIEPVPSRLGLSAAVAIVYLFLSAGFWAGGLPHLQSLRNGTGRLLRKTSLLPQLSLQSASSFRINDKNIISFIDADGNPIIPGRSWPKGLRFRLLQSYLIEKGWRALDAEKRYELKKSLVKRGATRICKYDTPAREPLTIRVRNARLARTEDSLNPPETTLGLFSCNRAKDEAEFITLKLEKARANRNPQE
ncbi:MAG: hypothetical protein JXA30_12135 [Deltaproteobacteria bacterium]|nr:hypothetical protein [Deltaproteobacteria bacterium]